MLSCTHMSLPEEEKPQTQQQKYLHKCIQGAFLPEKEQDLTQQQKFLNQCIQGSFWEQPDANLCFSFGQREDFRTVETPKYGPVVLRDPGRMLTLHFVPPDTDEYAAVAEAAKPERAGPISELAFVFRVQNYALADQFWETVKGELDHGETPLLRFGYHGMRNHSMGWANVLLNGLDPNNCTEGKYGMGTYLADNPGLSLAEYSHKFNSPVYKDLFDEHQEPKMDTYAIIGMFLLSLGSKQYVTRHPFSSVPLHIPPGYGAFTSPDGTQIVVQDAGRISPAYFLLYRSRKILKQRLLSRPEDGILLDFKDEYGRANAKHSVYWSQKERHGLEMDHMLHHHQAGLLDYSGLWDVRNYMNPIDLACRLCEMELGWRRASPLVHPNETVPYYCMRSGLRRGYTPGAGYDTYQPQRYCTPN